MIKSTESRNETEYHQSLKEAIIAVNLSTAKNQRDLGKRLYAGKHPCYKIESIQILV
jgi:hypothetical protein